MEATNSSGGKGNSYSCNRVWLPSTLYCLCVVCRKEQNGSTVSQPPLSPLSTIKDVLINLKTVKFVEEYVKLNGTFKYHLTFKLNSNPELCGNDSCNNNIYLLRRSLFRHRERRTDFFGMHLNSEKQSRHPKTRWKLTTLEQVDGKNTKTVEPPEIDRCPFQPLDGSMFLANRK